MDIGQIVAWFQAHWVDLTNVVAYLIAGASIIVKLTPTQADDEVLQKIVDFLSKYIALNK